MDGGDDDDGDSSRDNADDKDKEEEHLAPVDSAVVIPTDELDYRLTSSCHILSTKGRGQWIDYEVVSTLDAEARRRGIGEVGYGIKDTWVDPTETVFEMAPMTVGE
nr:hypothetical protein [Tanacetum cinerariifolium]